VILLSVDWTIRLGDVSAAIAILLSLISLVRTRKLAKLQSDVLVLELQLKELRLESERAEREKSGKADIGARFIRYGYRGGYRLKVFNKGKSVAKNIKLEVLDDGGIVLLDNIFPLEELEQDQSVELPVSVHLNSAKVMKLGFSWDDESGSNRQKELSAYR